MDESIYSDSSSFHVSKSAYLGQFKTTLTETRITRNLTQVARSQTQILGFPVSNKPSYDFDTVGP